MPVIPNSLQFHELFVISDLHFGGDVGFQIFDSTSEMVALIKHIGALPATTNAALLINGDFIDFLAEKPQRHFDPDGANAKLDRIASDATFKPIFEALSDLLGIANRTLIINLGNHDLELAMPWVREHLVQILCGSEAAKRGRLQFHMDGTGVRCRVGASEVLVLHGNEFDAWNVADYHHLRTMARDLQFGKPVKDWEPNAGARLVIEVMNEIKRERPFVDLLKPEVAAVVKVLAMIEQRYVKKLTNLTGIKKRKMDDVKRMQKDLLSVGARSKLISEPSANLTTEDQFFDALYEPDEARGVYKTALYEDAKMLGIPGAIWQKLIGSSECEILRVALDGLHKDQSFAFDDADDTYKSATSAISAEIPFVLTGHTHLMRAIARPRGGYFNSGTWARLIQVKPANLVDEQSFEPIYRALIAKTLPGIDAIQDQTGHSVVQKICPVVHLQNQGDRVIGRLARVAKKGGEYKLLDIDHAPQFQGK